MGIVARRSDEFLLPQHLIPFAKTLVRSLEIVCEKQIWITVVRPECIKECDESVNLTSVSKYVVNLDTVGCCFSCITKLFRISDDCQSVATVDVRQNFIGRMFGWTG